MKIITLFMLSLFSLPSFAGCVVSFKRPADRAMTTTFINGGTYKKIVSAMFSKGYEVISPDELNNKSPDYVLDVEGDYGYGTGLGDYLNIPGYYKIVFSVANGNKLFQKSESYVKTASGGVKAEGRQKVLSAINGIPKCDK